MYTAKKIILVANAVIIRLVRLSGRLRYRRSMAIHEQRADASGPIIPSHISIRLFAPTRVVRTNEERMAPDSIHQMSFISAR